jgi:hypothetical protein
MIVMNKRSNLIQIQISPVSSPENIVVAWHKYKALQINTN